MVEATLPNGNARCQKDGVASQDGRWFYQCKRAASVNNKWCKQHDPVAVAARETASQAKWDKEWERRKKELDGPQYYAVLKQIAAGHNDPRRLAKEALDDD